MEGMDVMEQVAVFGFTDTLAGQVVNFVGLDAVAFFISVKSLPELNVEEQHALRPNAKTEFVRNGRLFGKEVVVSADYVPLLRMRGIGRCLVLEDDRYLRREIIATLVENGIEVMSYVHPTAILCGHNTIGNGVVIFPQCYVGYKADVLDGTIVQSNCTIEHHSVIGQFCDINPNLTTGGFVGIGDLSEINMSVDIINRIAVGRHSRIGAGSLLLENTGENELWYGRPARFIRSNRVR
jgi:UDP-3-O-[3-hydroxymyristoyl] glucosamine N-acyltransferase